MTPSSGNVFTDLCIPDAAELDTKVRRAVLINRLIKKRRLSLARAAERLQVSHRKASSLKKYKLDEFSAEQLKGFLRALRGDANNRLVALMHKPPHPGEVLMDTVLRPDGGVTVAAFAQHLRIPRRALSRVVNGKAAVSAELAIRLASALRGSAESWLRLQMTHDLWHAQKARLPEIRPLERRRSAKDVGTLAEFFADSPLRSSGLKVKRTKGRG
jgi:addiction module HigA family antidote